MADTKLSQLPNTQDINAASGNITLNSCNIGTTTPGTGVFTKGTVDNIEIDGNTISSLSGDITLASSANINMSNTTLVLVNAGIEGDIDSYITMHGGTGAAILSPSGTISVGLTPVGNVGAGEDDLMTYTLPANSLSYATAGIRVTAWGTGANNINAKTVSLYVGGTLINTGALVASQANLWEAEILYFSTGANTQRYFSKLSRVSATAVDVTLRTQGTLTKTQSSDIIIKFTGTAISNDDVAQQGMIVEFLN